MAKPYTESIDYVYQWLDDTNRISENLGDPINVYVGDGDYTTHNASYPSYLINPATYTHDTLEQNAVVRSLNDLNDRKVKRTGDVVSGNFRFNQNVIIDLDLLVQGGDIITSATTFNLLNHTAATINFGEQGTLISIGAGSGTTRVNHDLAVNGGNVTTTATTFNLLNATATTVNAFGAATAINLGAATGTTTVNHSLLVKGGSGQSFTIDDGTTTRFTVDSTNGNTLISGTLGVTGDTTLTADLAVNGGDITTTAGTFNLLNATATTVNAFGAATVVNIGHNALTSVTNLRGDLNVDGNDVTTSQTTANIFNTTATTVNAFGAATTLTIGALTGTTTIRNGVTVQGGTAQSFIINDGTTNRFTVDSTNGNTQISGTLGVTGTSSLVGDVTITGDLAVNGGDITTTAATFNLLNATATTVNAFGATTALTIGQTTGTTTIRNATTIISGNLRVDGASISTNGAVTANVFVDGSVATLNLGTSATAISMGAATGTTTINNALLVKGGSGQSFIVDDGTTTRFSVDSTNGNTQISGTLGVTSAVTLSSTLGVTGNVTLTGDLAVNGGDITTTATTFNLLNATATTVTIGGAVTTFSLGHVATAAQTVNMFTASTGASTYNLASGPTVSGSTKTLNIGTAGVSGSTTNLTLGSTAGGTFLINSPNLRINNATNGVVFTSGGNGAVGVLTDATAGKMLRSGASAAPTWSTATYPAALDANSLLFAKTANVVESMQFISSDLTIAYDYSIAGKINLRTTGSMPSSILVIGDLRVGSNKSGTYSQTGTSTITLNVTLHGMTSGTWVYLDFTSGTGVDGAYEVTVTGPDTFTVQGSVQTTSGNVIVEIGGTGNITKVLSVGTDNYVPTTSLFVQSYDLNQITKLVEVQDSLGSTKFLIDPSGKTTISANLVVQGNIVNASSSGTEVSHNIVGQPVTTTSTAETTLLSIPSATYRSVEFQIQAVEGTKFWTSKVLAIHNGTDVNHTEYGMAGIGTSPVTSFAVDISTGNILLKVVSASASSTVYKVSAIAILA